MAFRAADAAHEARVSAEKVIRLANEAYAEADGEAGRLRVEMLAAIHVWRSLPVER